MQNHTNALVGPLVSFSKVMPKAILEKVAAKQETVAPMYVSFARTNALLMSIFQMCLPEPNWRPY